MLGFVMPLVKHVGLRQEIVQSKYRVEFFDYDWSINEQRPAKKKSR